MADTSRLRKRISIRPEALSWAGEEPKANHSILAMAIFA